MLARLKRLEEHYEQHGMRRTCEGVLVCHEHNHPHVLMLQIANAFFKLYVVMHHVSPFTLSLQLDVDIGLFFFPGQEITYTTKTRRSMDSRSA